MPSQVASYRNRPTTASSALTCSTLGLDIGDNGLGGTGNSEMVKRFRSEFPNLPGFSKFAALRPQSPKSQSLNFNKGYMMVRSPLPKTSVTLMDFPLLRPTTAPASSSSHLSLSKVATSPNDVSGRYSLLRQKKDRESNKITLPFCPKSKLPSFLEHDGRVLLFNAFYEEDVLQSTIEEKRIMKCEIFYYVEDGTIEIIQTKQENSGIPQGVFLRRSKVKKLKNGSEDEASHDSNDSYYEIDDFKIGNEVEIYSRIFRIVDCNESTKDYVVSNHGWHEVDVAPLPFPRDRFGEVYKVKMRRESGVPGVDRKRKMHDLKEVMESMLGKQMSTTDRGMFLECGQMTLCFNVVWDDRERLYGDLQYFRLFYFLADDTVEILPVQKKNDGRYASPKLLKRMKLPKEGQVGSSEFYSWKDLSIGEKINVFGRSMHLASCDIFTREYYRSHGIKLADESPFGEEEDKIDFVRQIPPYNGFGSEEDSLRSCTGGINPPPAKRDISKMREKQGVILRFNARLLSDDTKRRFVIQYFMEDDTIAIQEPPIRNSGVMGGKFLRRQVVKKHDGGKYLARDMYCGNVVDFMCHNFELLNADEYTYRLMENDHRTFPYSEFSRMHKELLAKQDEIRKYFATTYTGDGKIDMDELGVCLGHVGFHLKKQQLITIWRKIDKKRMNKVSFTKLMNILEVEGEKN